MLAFEAIDFRPKEVLANVKKLDYLNSICQMDFGFTNSCVHSSKLEQ